MAKATFATCSVSWASLPSMETTDNDVLLAAQCWKEVDLKLASFSDVGGAFLQTLTGTQVHGKADIVPEPTCFPLILWK